MAREARTKRLSGPNEQVAFESNFCYFTTMSTVLEIESAIRELPQEEFWKLAEWFDEAKADAWDQQMEADARAGRLRQAAEKAMAQFRAGETQALP
jgi:hypothetical protein